MPINPAFLRYPLEAISIGHLLAAFGELEISVCVNASKATQLGDLVLSALYRIRATRSRLDAADALMRPIYTAAGLENGYADAISRVMHCLRIRNQFAHCNWADHVDAGLFFCDLSESARTPTFETFWKHIDTSLLTLHEAYFDASLEALRFMDHEISAKLGILQSHWWPKPPTLEQPLLHNPEIQHIPPWLTEDAKALHVARAQAALGGTPTPTPAHNAMEAAREAKRAKRQADRERAKRSTPESQQ